jgi:hypothetical protein
MGSTRRLARSRARRAPARSRRSRPARGEPVSAAHLLVAAVCSYLIGYRFYSKFIAARVLALDAARRPRATRLDDGRDFVPTQPLGGLRPSLRRDRGPGPLSGPTLAAQFGYLPGHDVDPRGRRARGRGARTS